MACMGCKGLGPSNTAGHVDDCALPPRSQHGCAGSVRVRDQGVGWFLAFVGALSSLFLCEVYKPFAKSGEQAALPVYEENTVLRVRV